MLHKLSSLPPLHCRARVAATKPQPLHVCLEVVRYLGECSCMLALIPLCRLAVLLACH